MTTLNGLCGIFHCPLWYIALYFVVYHKVQCTTPQHIMQCIHCNMFCGALFCAIVVYGIVFCGTLHCALWCIVLCFCGILHYALWYIVLCVLVHCIVLLWYIALCFVVQCIVLRGALHCVL